MKYYANDDEAGQIVVYAEGTKSWFRGSCHSSRSKKINSGDRMEDRPTLGYLGAGTVPVTLLVGAREIDANEAERLYGQPLPDLDDHIG